MNIIEIIYIINKYKIYKIYKIIIYFIKKWIKFIYMRFWNIKIKYNDIIFDILTSYIYYLWICLWQGICSSCGGKFRNYDMYVVKHPLCNSPHQDYNSWIGTPCKPLLPLLLEGGASQYFGLGSYFSRINESKLKYL